MSWQRVCLAIGLAMGGALWSDAAAAQANDPAAPPANKQGAKVNVEVNLSSQRMYVDLPDGTIYSWPISSGRPGLATPSGKYQVEWMDADHVSREYDDAPMPYAIFFNLKGDAIHGSYQRAFGSPQSHGCVRLPVADAKILFAAIKTYGGAKIDIFGTARRGPPVIVAQRHAPAAPRSDRRYAAASQGDYSYGDDTRGGYDARPNFVPPARWFGLPIWGADRD